MENIIGYLLILSGILIWFVGYFHVRSLYLKRLDLPKLTFDLRPLRFRMLNGQEKKILFAIFLLSMLLWNLGNWILRK